MKKLSTLLIIFLGIFSIVTSCKKDDPLPTLDGNWALVAADVTVTNGQNQVINNFNIPISQFAEKDKLEIQFSNGKIISQVDADGNATITSIDYRIDGSTLVAKTGDAGQESVYAQYSLTNTDLTMIFTEISPDGKIETKLVYRKK